MRPFLKTMCAVGLFSVALAGTGKVWGQPLGIMSAQTPQKTRKEVLGSTNGRFVFGQISAARKDQFMLDTFSGRLWRIAESGKIGIFLKPVPYRDEDGECSFLPKDPVDSEPKEDEKP